MKGRAHLLQIKVSEVDYRLLHRVAKNRGKTFDEVLADMVWAYLFPVKGR